MTIVLYGMDISPPVRSCQLVLRALNLPYTYKNVNLLQGEHHTEAYLKKNPQHTVPLLDDHGLCIWDSHAIVCYLVDKYAKSDELYPKDLAKRALVNQRLYFEATILYMSLRNISVPYFYNNVSTVPKEKVDNVRAGYEHLENFIADNAYVTGNNLTVADFCCAATISSLAAVLDLDPQRYPKTTQWLARISELPYYGEANGLGAQKYIKILKPVLTTE
ncbi:glutathione S-transferase 1 [Drosophila tropicalis]|uniref:glutathione S-transferase 1 n=1 Tax=Drosophila tropicalis TaxID=46794 RepID=UPI0035ABD407